MVFIGYFPNFLVFFPVSRESDQRVVRDRLSPPPDFIPAAINRTVNPDQPGTRAQKCALPLASGRAKDALNQSEATRRVEILPLDNRRQPYFGQDCTSRMIGSMVSIGSAVSVAVTDVV